MISKGTKTYKNHTRYTRNIPEFHVMLQRMFSPTINQTLPASIPQLQTAPHRRQKPNQWWVAWGRLGELARSRRRTRFEGWFASGPPGGTSSLWSTRSGGNVSFGPSAFICIRFFLLGERFGYCCSTRKELQVSEANWIKLATPPLARA